MILADTSAWVEYDRATGSTVDQRMTELVSDDGPLVYTEPVVMEVLAGARTDARERDLRRLLLRFHLLRFDAAVDVSAATRVYRACRRSGITPLGLIDCMIAAAAKDVARAMRSPWTRLACSTFWMHSRSPMSATVSARPPRPPLRR